jgi:hypothetical protein
MITLCELIEATTWLKPQDHMKVSLWDKSRVYDEDEFVDIDLTVRNLAKYGSYFVGDIDVDYNSKGELILTCMIWKD